jgi:tRNA dimethylallyltransferase
MDELGLEYRYLAQYLQGKIAREPMIELLSTRIWQYARRQKTWFRKDKRIQWVTPPFDIEKIAATFSAMK